MIEEASGIYDSNDGRGAENGGEKGNKRKDDE